ncbi:glycosyltransferase family 4 protein [Microvirga sp. 2YAF29]|uniref:glycosyltransferase family 4 protein n=1 Tax=Microvirga sp. 2YAF29 TaxID=3233031 RepID=UPI003F965FB7
MNTSVLDPQPERRTRVILHYWGRRGGGSEFTLSLAQHLRRSAPEIDVALSLSRHNEESESFKALGLPIFTFDRPGLSTLWRKVWSLPGALRRHADALAATKPDAVIITMNAPFAWPFASALKRRGIRVVYVVHDAEPHPGDYAVLWQRITQDLLIRGADQLVALSGSVRERLEQRFPEAAGKVSVIPLATAYPTKRLQKAYDGGPIRLLFYGRLLPYKGLDLLASALEALRANPGWRLTIAGSGPLEGEVQRLFEAWPQVDLELGWISDRRAQEMLSDHHLLLCPYVEASQSGVVVQAMSWAMPSLVMQTGSLPEQIGFGRAGLISPTAGADGFRKCLQTVLNRPDALTELFRTTADWLAECQANRGWSELIDPIQGPGGIPAPAK